MRKKSYVKIAFYFAIIFSTPLCHAYGLEQDNFNPKTVKRHQLEIEARNLAKAGFYDNAIAKFREALSPEYIEFEFEKGMATGSIVHILIFQEKYDEAFEEWKWFIEQNKKNNEAQITAEEIISLKKFKETRNPEYVRSFIELYRQNKYKLLPPSFEWGPGPAEVSTVLRLYDTIGDPASGIGLIDEVLVWAYENEKALEPLRNHRIDNASDAIKCAAKDKPVEERDPTWRGCSWLAEYLLVREAFEKDDVEGAKGRATKALIQSDYFPW